MVLYFLICSLHINKEKREAKSFLVECVGYWGDFFESTLEVFVGVLFGFCMFLLQV